jgi:hypothetical protein
MSSSRPVQYTLGLILVFSLLAGCGGVAQSDITVCENYQKLVDVWPSNAEDVETAGPATEIWENITDAGEALILASESAATAELGEVGQRVGEAAVSFPEINESLVKQGFIPFFKETFVSGSELSLMCKEIDSTITLP